MDKFPRLETNRLILEKLYFTDIPKIIEYAGNINIFKTTLNIPHPYGERDAIFWLNSANQGFENKTQYTFGIRIKSSHEFAGAIGLIINSRFDRAEMGYWIAEPFWNNGYATEGAKAIVKFGFEELNLNKIYATHLVENPASGKVMVRNGMTKEGELKEHVKKGKAYLSLFQYAITKSEYEVRH
jgi:RimJ/RimL family protein N-acetyltransferase